jgi:acyl dehydratase
VPSEARQIAALDLGPRAGLDFAKLTGDMNPIHWFAPYARAAGFRGCILHGFATLARAVEALNRTLPGRDPMRLSSVDVRFSRPLLLPARFGVYVSDASGLWVGDGPGGDVYLEGHFQLENA